MFLRKLNSGIFYWYHCVRRGDKVIQKYVRKATDEEVRGYNKDKRLPKDLVKKNSG